MRLSERGLAILCLSALGCSGPDRDLPPEYRRVAIPEQRLGSDAARQRGRQIFEDRCVLCHGERADGRGARSEALSPRPADLTSAEWRCRTSARLLFYRIREGVPGTAMPAWKALSEGETWDLVAYLATPRGDGCEARGR
jgi:mono/diheme cytochrome c family protein